jgi:hypothetical protein
MTTPAGLAGFKRSMITRFKGTCEWCGEATTPGIDYAALGGDAKWFASCVACSASTSARIAGICNRIAKVQDSLTAEQLATLEPIPANLADAIRGTLSDAEMVIVTAHMVAMRRSIDALLNAAPAAVTLAKGGIYTVNGVLYSIRESKTGNLYAMQATGEPQEGRKLSWEYAKGAIRTVERSGVRLTAEQAAAIGHLTSHCCFCSLELTDQRSVDMGYGPVCAANNALPWGG